MNTPLLAGALLGALALQSLAGEPAQAAEKAAPPTGFLFQTLRHGGKDYKYIVYVPREFSTVRTWPVILFLHGAGECGADGMAPMRVGIATHIMRQPEKWPFVVVIPQKPTAREQWEQHEGAVMAMLDDTIRQYKGDRSRVYITGLSQGGHGTWVLAARHPKVFAAAAPICGYGNRSEVGDALAESNRQLGEKLKNMPLWAFHGEADDVVPARWTRDLSDAMEQAGGHPKVTLYPGVDHNSWDRAYGQEDIPGFFLAHKK